MGVSYYRLSSGFNEIAPKVKTSPIMEAVAKSLHGIETVPAPYMRTMVKRAASEALRAHDEVVVPLKQAILEIRKELYQHTEGNFFSDWLTRVDKMLTAEEIAAYSEGEQET